MGLLVSSCPRIRDAWSLEADIRQCDREEWVMASGRPVGSCLVEALSLPNTRVVLNEDGKCLAMWGHVSDPKKSGVASAWMVATNEALRRVHEMHRFFKDGITEMHKDHHTLIASAAHHNVVHHRWMLRMGFKQTDLDTRNELGFRFILFTRRQRE